MEDEFSEFKSSTTVFEVDLLEFKDTSPIRKIIKENQVTEQQDAPAPLPSQPVDISSLPKPPTHKKRQFIFPTEYTFEIAPNQSDSILDLNFSIQNSEAAKQNP